MPITNTALSGLGAATSDLEVISNNISNSKTVGFKSSSINFADVYAINGSPGNQIGKGVRVAGVTQDFTTGSATLTGKTLDLSISGEGFFSVRNSAGYSYTRDGQFYTDKSGNIVNQFGSILQGYAYNSNNILSSSLSDLQISTGVSAPQATSKAATQINLDSRSVSPGSANPPIAFDYTDPSTYNARSDLTVYDTLGNPHTLSSYFYKDPATTNTWQMSMYLDASSSAPIGPIGGDTNPQNSYYTVTFGTDGLISSAGIPAGNVPTQIDLTVPAAGAGGLNNGSSALSIKYDLAKSTQYGSTTITNSNTQDGFSSGTVTGVNIDNSGVISMRYSNGAVKSLGVISIAKFTNPQGLLNLGNQSWAQTNSSGVPDTQVANSSNAMQSGSLEDSNVDLPRNLVNLIATQRYFQANTQAIQVSNTILDSVINIR